MRAWFGLVDFRWPRRTETGHFGEPELPQISAGLGSVALAKVLLGGARRRVVIGGRSALDLVRASECADAVAVAANNGARAGEPAEITNSIDLT